MGWPGGWPPANCSRTSITKHNVAYTMQRAPSADADTSYSEDWRPDLVNSSFVAAVQWSDAGNFLADMLGAHQKVGDKVRRVNPERHPLIPNLRCVGCRL